MYNKRQFNTKTSMKVNKSTDGESMELKMARITQNKEPIKDGADLIYTDRKDGVQAGFNIRTDRFEVAIEAMDIVQQSKMARRQEFIKKLEEKNNPQQKAGETAGDTGGSNEVSK